MANPAAVIGLTYRGTDIQQPFASGAAAFFLEIVRGLDEPASVRGSDVIVPSRVGRLAGARTRDLVTVELQGIIIGAQGATEGSTFRIRATTLRALFDPTLSGSLVATLEDGTTKTLTATRTVDVLWDLVYPTLARVNVQLESIAGEWT